MFKYRTFKFELSIEIKIPLSELMKVKVDEDRPFDFYRKLFRASPPLDAVLP